MPKNNNIASKAVLAAGQGAVVISTSLNQVIVVTPKLARQIAAQLPELAGQAEMITEPCEATDVLALFALARPEYVQ
jgi:hypothetical protein